MKRGHIMLVLIAIFFCTTAKEASTQYRWNVMPATNNGYGIAPAITIGQEGEIFIAHHQYYAPHYKLVVSHFKNGVWLTELVEDDPRNDDIYSGDIKIDAEGNVHLVYGFSLPGQNKLKHAFKANDGGEWEITTIIDDMVSSPSVDIDSEGRVHVAYVTLGIIGSDLSHAYRENNGDWHVEDLEYHSWSTLSPHIAIDSIDRVHIIYLATFMDYYYSVEDEYFWTMTGTWNGEAYDWEKDWIQYFDQYLWHRHTSMTLDSADRLHIVMRDPLNNDLVYYHQRHSGIWFEETIESIGNAGWRCAIAATPDDGLCVAYNTYGSGTDGALKLAWKKSGDHVWRTQILDADVQYDEDTYRSGTAITVDSHGCPHIAYFDRNIDESSGIMFLKYARGTEHGPLPGQVVVSPGPDPEPGVHAGATINVLWRDGFDFHQFHAYGTTAFGANTACGDVNADGFSEIVTGPGPGPAYAPLVRVFETDGTPLPGAIFPAYTTDSYGVNVACGDINGDLKDEILTGAGPGRVYGPHIRAFSYTDGRVSPLSGVSFLAYNTRQYGVNPATGDIDGDGIDEIITGPGPGRMFGPHVRAWNYDGKQVTAIQGAGFMAYNTNSFGVVVSAGDVNGDGVDEILTAPGPGSGFGSHVRGWRFTGTAVVPMNEINFFAFPGATAGATLGCGDVNGDGVDEFAVGMGPHPGAVASVKLFQLSAGEPLLLMEIIPQENRFGVNISLGGNVSATRIQF